ACCPALCLTASSFSNDSATPQISALSLHDALPILAGEREVVVEGVGLVGKTDPTVVPGGDAGLLGKVGAAGRLIVRPAGAEVDRSEEHTSELQSRENLVCRLLLEKKKRSPSRTDSR